MTAVNQTSPMLALFSALSPELDNVPAPALAALGATGVYGPDLAPQGSAVPYLVYSPRIPRYTYDLHGAVTEDHIYQVKVVTQGDDLEAIGLIEQAAADLLEGQTLAGGEDGPRYLCLADQPRALPADEKDGIVYRALARDYRLKSITI